MSPATRRVPHEGQKTAFAVRTLHYRRGKAIWLEQFQTYETEAQAEKARDLYPQESEVIATYPDISMEYAK